MPASAVAAEDAPSLSGCTAPGRSHYGWGRRGSRRRDIRRGEGAFMAWWDTPYPHPYTLVLSLFLIPPFQGALQTPSRCCYPMPKPEAVGSGTLDKQPSEAGGGSPAPEALPETPSPGSSLVRAEKSSQCLLGSIVRAAGLCAPGWLSPVGALQAG